MLKHYIRQYEIQDTHHNLYFPAPSSWTAKSKESVKEKSNLEYFSEINISKI